MAEHEPAIPVTVTFGDELRREREIRGISLKEIADATKVSKRFLEAIERNDYRKLPAAVFTRGFIREYARYLGLNADDMVTRYMHYVETTSEEPPVRPLTSASVIRSRREVVPPPSRIGPRILVGIALLAVVGALGYWIVRGRPTGGATIGLTRSLRRTVAAPAPAVAKPPAVPAAAAAVTESASAEPTGLHLRIDVVDDSWVDLQADGKTILNGEMKRGESRTFDATQEFRFSTIGNAAGLELTLNGTKLPPLGATGQVIRDRRYDLQTVREAVSAQTQS
jgi:cytoskeleton protein RodZ